MASEAPIHLRRTLSVKDLIVYGLLFIGPTAPMGVFGVLDAKSGGATALVFVVATVAMGFTAWSYARMSRAVPRAGSVSAYATAGLGRWPGFFAGWMAGLDYLFIPAVAALFTGIATHSLVSGVPTWLATGVGIIVFTALNLAGVGIAARVGMIMLVIEVVVLAMFIVGAIVVLVHDGPSRGWLSPLASTSNLAIGGVLGAVSVAVLSFLGFDAIATFAEENTGSSRQVGRAVLFCLALAGLLFVAQTYLADLVSDVSPQHLAAHPDEQGTAFYTVIRHAIGGWFGTTVSAVKAVGPVFSALVAQAAVSRLMYGMARQGHLPSWLGRVNPRTRTPRAAILVSAAATLILAIWAATQPNGLDTLSSMVTVGALVAFVLLHASVFGYFVVRRETRAGSAGVRTAATVVPALGVAIIIALLIKASHLALVVGACWLAVGIAVAVARYVTGHRGDPSDGAPSAPSDETDARTP
ncbi:APC family permease [Streptomyces sp. NRRL F-5126]|uniref:APC family permease n=1 Tax=Streptomyces sp. NRRL F-5126 TaxID=1463857 RepID=UPI000691DEB9|nr:APC family permease [Streptomyces sp. NRRL F-5126]